MATPNLALSPVCRWAARYIHTSTHLYTPTPLHPYIYTSIHPYVPTPTHPYFPYPGVCTTTLVVSWVDMFPEYVSWLEGDEHTTAVGICTDVRYMTEEPVTPPYPPLGVVVYTARFL